MSELLQIDGLTPHQERRAQDLQGHAAVSARVGADGALSGAAVLDRRAARSRPSRHPARHQHRDVRPLLHDRVPDLDQGPAVDAAQGAAGEREAGRADGSGSGPDGGAGTGGRGRCLRSRVARRRSQADRAGRAVLRSRQARMGAEYLPRGDAVHFRRLLSGLARVLSDGKQPRLPARRLQGTAWPVSTTSR